MDIMNLSESQIETLETALEDYDRQFAPAPIDHRISIGIVRDGEVIAGLDASMTAFRILYVSTVYVAQAYRRQGYGRSLMEEMERRAKALGANTVRLDSFSWQGREFYQALGYQEVGHYRNDTDDYEEYFFIKRI